jgi:hypothetical protein
MHARFPRPARPTPGSSPRPRAPSSLPSAARTCAWRRETWAPRQRRWRSTCATCASPLLFSPSCCARPCAAGGQTPASALTSPRNARWPPSGAA